MSLKNDGMITARTLFSSVMVPKTLKLTDTCVLSFSGSFTASIVTSVLHKWVIVRIRGGLSLYMGSRHRELTKGLWISDVLRSSLKENCATVFESIIILSRRDESNNIPLYKISAELSSVNSVTFVPPPLGY